jgi:hypothetical protein
MSVQKVAPSLKWISRVGAQFNIGVSYEGIEVENTTGRYINTISNTIEEFNNYFGINAAYNFENYDNAAFPTLGMTTTLEAGWKGNVTNSNENHLYFRPSLGFDYKLASNGKIVVATKFKGNIIIGDTFEFYHAASIGGKDGLRGYRNQRFIGNRSYHQNIDLRFNLSEVKTSLLPFKIGVFGGFDYGRVWRKNESSNDWKTSYGAGFWLVGAEMINLNFSLFDSDEGAQFNFGLGFQF